jgi:hypothetical protein
MVAEMGKPCSSGEEVLALKKYLTRSVTDQERLRELIQRNKEKDDFLAGHR